MKNRILKKIGASLTALGCLSCASGFFCCPKAYVNTVTSPLQSDALVQNLMDGNDQSVISTLALIEKQDNNFNITFNSSMDYNDRFLPEPEAGMMYFAVFMDHRTGTNLAMQPLVKGVSIPGTSPVVNQYTTSYTAPANVDMVDVHIYKQQDSLPSYYPIAGNFIGKLKLFTAANDIYLRQSNTQTQITGYKPDGTAIDDQTNYYFNRLTPNLFTFYNASGSPDIQSFFTATNCVVVIEPTADGGGQNMKQEDKVIPLTGFVSYNPSTATVPNSAKALPNTSNTLMANLYIPEDLTSFYLKIYNGSVASTNLKLQYYVNLNRQ